MKKLILMSVISVLASVTVHAKALEISCNLNKDVYEPQFTAHLTLEVADDNSFKGQIAYSTLINHAATLEDRGVQQIEGHIEVMPAGTLYVDEVQNVQFISTSGDHKLGGGLLIGKDVFSSKLVMDTEVEYISACK